MDWGARPQPGTRIRSRAAPCMTLRCTCLEVVEHGINMFQSAICGNPWTAGVYANFPQAVAIHRRMRYDCSGAFGCNVALSAGHELAIPPGQCESTRALSSSNYALGKDRRIYGGLCFFHYYSFNSLRRALKRVSHKLEEQITEHIHLSLF
ncbi:uncharacterized protein EI90DRAFT_3062382 [Cantharellus anzutake]|uniref:uncharacterized protein n=1 Tax=Cantharellus anzutake TaxID=1750568 RepID=UPI001908A7DD|nr:uncharacterized protein EI90DRAFT_3062382 [Cantharellus anzutake]KAF8329364.1 hypothetical protein EI90DRAFT_3062382 [Cantharellus anzutake]